MCLATWFGCGYTPVAPGTVGSIAAWIIALAAGIALDWGRAHLIAAILLTAGPAIWAAGRAAVRAGDHDPQHVVIDEVLGMWLTLCGATVFNWRSSLLALALFRVFDIWKPFPVRQLESLPGGVGIVADDVAAGVWAALVLCLAGWFNFY